MALVMKISTPPVGGGELWHYDGERWQRIDIPTNIAFHKLVCAANGIGFAVIDAGNILKEKGTGFVGGGGGF